MNGTEERTGAWPEGYPSYFDEHQVVKREYVVELAESIAARFQLDGLTRNQLQAFYRHVRRLSDSLDYVDAEGAARVLRKLDAVLPKANYAFDRKVIPASFNEFMKRNIDRCSDARTFRQGFVEHFQAVVGFCAGKLKDQRGGQ